MQEMQRPDGSLFQELFTGEQVKDGAAERRRKLLGSFGMTFKKLEEVDASKYSPHQNSREMERRVKQMLKAAQKPSEPA